MGGHGSSSRFAEHVIFVAFGMLGAFSLYGHWASAAGAGAGLTAAGIFRAARGPKS